ncbi:MAG: dihydrolipoyl dehydrogenase [Fimbriimonadales bacterium]
MRAPSHSNEPASVIAPSKPRSRKRVIEGAHGTDVIPETALEPLEKKEPMSNGRFEYDVCVIGAGPGGYVAAIRAAQHGLHTACVEKSHLGGTCLNWGCIPSKVMIAAVERFEQVKHADKMGIELPGQPAFDFAKMMDRKDKVVDAQRRGIAALFKKNKVDHLQGQAVFLDPNTVELVAEGEKRRVTARNFIIATGSSAVRIPIPGLTGDNVWTSDDAVTATSVPKRMLILGGGAVGCEFAYVFSGAGAEVTLVEMMPNLVPMMDEDLGKELAKLFGRSKIKVHLNSTLERCERNTDGWHCFVTTPDGVTEVVVDVVLLGVGRRANTEGLNVEKVGVHLHKRGIEVINERMQTHVPHIYAIGDVIGKIQLAHVASAEGLVAAANCAGIPAEMSYKAVPDVVYTAPELAAVGMTEKAAAEAGRPLKIGRFAFRPLGRAMAALEQEGFVKVVADAEHGEVLGVHMIGPHASSLIHEAVAAVQMEATLEELERTIHAHPSFAEALGEAIHDAQGHAIHKA